MKKVFLKKNEEKRILSGHLWVFSNEILQVDGEPENGDLVEVYSSKERLLASGFYNKNSLIAVRIIKNGPVDDLAALFRYRISSAYKLRKEVYPLRESFRMVFSESDLLPGLIIDKFNSTFVLQINSFGVEKNADLIINILKEDYFAENIFTKNENYFRSLECLPAADTVYFGSMKDEVIDDGSIQYLINFGEGQKTGFFFDQSDNRFFIEKIVKEKTVLDAFCNAGGFGMHALSAGITGIDFVDSSAAEINAVKSNYSLNGFTTPAQFIQSDVFDFLQNKISSGENYDVVMIDPPAFTKGRKNLPQARKGYEKLNRLALGTVNNGGYLVTSSCSFHLSEEDFLEVINSAAIKAGRELQLIHFNGASLDHPVLPSMKETKYLKFAVMKVNYI